MVLTRSLNHISYMQKTTIGYIGEVAFPQGMISSYKNKFRFIQQMDGTAEIITKDTRLIERFVQPIESLFKNH